MSAVKMRWPTAIGAHYDGGGNRSYDTETWFSIESHIHTRSRLWSATEVIGRCEIRTTDFHRDKCLEHLTTILRNTDRCGQQTGKLEKISLWTGT